MKKLLNKFITWVRTHKLSTVLIIVILYWLMKQSVFGMLGVSLNRMPVYESYAPAYGGEFKQAYSLGAPAGISRGMDYFDRPIQQEFTPTDTAERMVVQHSNLSLLVKNVSQTVQMIKSHAESLGGYMVDANISNPIDAANGTITVRVPAENFETTLAYFRELSVKVVSENLQGTDVTDQFQDIGERLRILEGNKFRMEQLMAQTVEISDMIQIQQQIFQLQDQIDSLKGQQQYLSQTSRLAKVTVYLSTDELALPYAPSESWRPAVIFKQAVRSVLTHLQKLGTLVIWLVVYSIIWIPLFVLYRMWRRRSSRTKTSTFKLQ